MSTFQLHHVFNHVFFLLGFSHHQAKYCPEFFSMFKPQGGAISVKLINMFSAFFLPGFKETHVELYTTP